MDREAVRRGRAGLVLLSCGQGPAVEEINIVGWIRWFAWEL
jgi:hypothetical protein